MSNENFKGSEWRKWDLHIHTPASLVHHYKGHDDEERWESFIQDLENLPKEFSVIGINDYLFIDGYEKVLEYRSRGRLKNISTIFPVLEFRIKKFAGNDKFKRINYHIIFSDKLDIETIRRDFINNISIEYESLSFNRALTRETLSNLGQAIIDSVPDDKKPEFGNPLIEGFNNYNIDQERIISILESRDELKGKFLTAIGKAEWDQFKWDDNTIADKRELINRSDIVFISSEFVDNFKKSKNSLTKSNVNDNLLDCSDAHYNSDSSQKDRIGKCFTWIKADPTFEGLKQILHEPNYRVHIGESPPINPPIYIPSIELNFPDNTTMGAGDIQSSFCLRGNPHKLLFSPNDTCIIGGRGTGKSTILNLLVRKLNPKLAKDQIPIRIGGKEITESDFLDSNLITIDKSVLGVDFEYLSQNQIEAFAKDTNELTKSLANRLSQRDSTDNLSNYRKDIVENDNFFVRLLDLKRQLRELNQKLISDKKLFDSAVNIRDSFDSQEYREMIASNNNIENDYNHIIESKALFSSLFTSLKSITDKHKTIDTVTSNLYSTNHNLMLSELNKVVNKYSTEIFTDTDNKIMALENQKKVNKNKIDIFLKSNDLSEDNINRLAKIPSEIADLEQRKKADEKIKSELEQEINKYSSCIPESYDKKLLYENTFMSLIDEVNASLKDINSTHVKPICLKYEFSFDKAKEKLYDQFCDEFKTEISLGVIRPDVYLSQIFKECVDIESMSNGNIDYSSFLRNITSHSSSSKAKTFLSELFQSQSNYDRLKILCKRIYCNAVDFAIIEVTYDGRLLKNTSFGQRCTAVLILLIHLGATPIIIDEPEAHLDSLLIANYLVELIKKQKKHRQIIFATHNANFVINGDAELIYILEEGENGTIITPTTIENRDYKDRLIALEGGQEAFNRREKRYRLSY